MVEDWAMTTYDLHAIIIALFVQVALWAAISVMACRETRHLRREVARLKAELEAERRK